MPTTTIKAPTRALLGAATLLTLLLSSETSRAATFNVACTSGVGDDTALSAAFATAASNGEADTIILGSNCTYTMTSVADTSLDNTALAPVTDDGGFATSLKGNGSTITYDPAGDFYGRFLLINGGTMNVDSTTFLGGYSHDDGGAIRVESGTLNLTNSTINAGINQNAGTGGAGLAVESGATATLVGCWITQCFGVTGGGVYNAGGTLSVVNTTIEQNASTLSGGAIAASGGSTTVVNSTIWANDTDRSLSGGKGGGLYNEGGGTFSVSNSIVADNSTDNSTSNESDAAGTFVDVGHNLLGSTAGSHGFTVSTLVGQDPQLDGPADNGGPTETDSLATVSPALGAADPAVCAAAPVNGVDQRGVSRPAASCDIGAYQLTRSLALALTSSTNPSMSGEGVTLTGNAAVTPVGLPLAAKVTILDGTTELATGTVDGSGNFVHTTVTLAIGSHALTLTYPGDALFPASASAVLTQVVEKASSTTTLATSTNRSKFDQRVTFTATVAPSSATGVVTFLDGTTSLGTATLAGGVASFKTATLAVGDHAITATYAGDGEAMGSTSAVVKQRVGKEGVTAALTSSGNPSVAGASVTFTATLTPDNRGSTPTGDVTFEDGTTALGTGALAGGVATFETGALAAGTHTITAVYAGDPDFNGDTTASITQDITAAPVADAGVGTPDATTPHDAGKTAAKDAGTKPHPSTDAATGLTVDAAAPTDVGSSGGCALAGDADPASGTLSLGFALAMLVVRRRRSAA